jgi:integrase
MLTVRRALQYLPGEGLTPRETKTARARRTIPLGPTATEALKQRRRRQLEEQPALGPAYRNSGFVFADPMGDTLPPYRVSQRFTTLAKRLGLAPLRFHDLRHTHASLLLTRGVHPKVVSERLGHASIAITLDTYSHVLPSLQEEAGRDLDAWLAGRA